MSKVAGIVAFGAYIPRLRLQRASIVAATGWFNAALKAHGKGERALANWDEDSITMAVEAARDCLGERDRQAVKHVCLASTNLPFSDRQNAGIVKEALNLQDETSTIDIAGSQRAGTSALIQSLHGVAGGVPATLCIAAEKRRTQSGSELELLAGDAAAAFLLGDRDLLARYVAGHSTSVDLVDHYRGSTAEFDYGWEARWVREEGYLKIVPSAIAVALEKAKMTPRDIHRFVMPGLQRGIDRAVAEAAGIPPDAIGNTLMATVGDTGAAHGLLLLANALENAGPNENIMVVGFGQGCDVLIFQATDQITSRRARIGVKGWLARRKPEENYTKYLAFSGQLAMERGMRAELDQKTALTALYRNRKSVFALVGGRCTETGVVQFPKTPIGVSQQIGNSSMLEDYPFADRLARILTYTADNLAYSPDPPSYYGMIEFIGGGRMSAEFTDVEPGDVEVGVEMNMVFRIRAVDETRHFVKYFWKAAPRF